MIYKYYFILFMKLYNILIFTSIIIYLYLNQITQIKLIRKIRNFESKTIISENEIKEFLTINKENILLDIKKYNRTNFPDISIIITVYNQANCIHKSLRSVQNQSLKNIEIIIIDDCSMDNSIEIIEYFQKEDNRIILIKHDINEGKIKTRSEGIRIAKGKYITIIDGDDELIHRDILNNSLHIANLGNLDIVEFQLSEYRNRTLFYIHNDFKINRIIFQPELSKKFIKIKKEDTDFAIINRSICAKLIKNNLFKKIILFIGPKYTEDYLLIYEDTIMAFSLYKFANSYYLMNQKGYYYSRDEYQNKNIPYKNKKCKLNEKKSSESGAIKFLEFLFDKTKNNKKDKLMLFHEIMSINYYLNLYNYINNNFGFIYFLFDNMIKSGFLSYKQKKKIIELKINLKEKEKSIKNII